MSLLRNPFVYLVGGVVLVVLGVTVFGRGAPRVEKTFDSGTIVAFGDSLTYGPEVGTGNSYPEQLQKLLEDKGYTGFKVVNMGVNGNTAADGLGRVDQVIALDPEIVIVTLGGNDLLQKLDVARMQQSLESIIQKLQKSGAVVVLGGMRAAGPGLTNEYKDAYDAVYPEIAEKYRVLLIPDFLKGVRFNRQYNLADYIHPNAAGYELIVRKNVFPVLSRLLQK